MNITIDLDTALESLDNILMTDKERYASMEAYLDELVSRDSYDEVNALFESVNEYDSVMEEENENNKKSIIEKIKKAIAWLKKKFFDIISAIGKFIKKMWDKLKSLFNRKKKTRKEEKEKIQKTLDKIENIEKSGKLTPDLEMAKENLKRKYDIINLDTSFYEELYQKLKNNITPRELNILFNLTSVHYLSSGIQLEIGNFEKFEEAKAYFDILNKDMNIEDISPSNKTFFVNKFILKIEKMYQEFEYCFKKISSAVKNVSDKAENGKKVISNKLKELDVELRRIEESGDQEKISIIQKEILNTNKYMELYVKYQSEIINILNLSINAYEKLINTYNEVLTADIEIKKVYDAME